MPPFSSLAPSRGCLGNDVARLFPNGQQRLELARLEIALERRDLHSSQAIGMAARVGCNPFAKTSENAWAWRLLPYRSDRERQEGAGKDALAKPSGGARYVRKEVVPRCIRTEVEPAWRPERPALVILRSRVRAPPLRRLPAASLRQTRLVQDGPQVGRRRSRP